jgi:NhaP-type Na+/H+ or K+/H+ antiporter
VLLGPDLLGIIQPATLGHALHTLVGFAVAVILFEGGMNLNLRRLRREARSIRQLVTLGALVTAAGGALAAHYIMHWAWTPAILFGALVIVTGPTVITPLLRRIRVHRKVATVLEAEGVLIDAIGAILAVVTLEVAISKSDSAITFAAWDIVSRLGFGVLLGAVGGALIALLLRYERVVPEGLENVLTLSLALVLFQGSNALLPESGIVTVVVAGLVVGNVRTRALSELKEFKEQLTVLFIGMLFVLLAADVRIDEVRSLGAAGLWTVLVLMLVVWPLNIAVGTFGSDLKFKEKVFLSWMAPRGIVAAAVASLFAQTLTQAGMPIGNELRAMVFLVIAVTVLVQGLTGGLLARLLGLRRLSNSGYAILGANRLARAYGAILSETGQEIVYLESNPDLLQQAQSEGLKVLYGTGLSESLMHRADLDGRAGGLAITPNEGVNLLFARRAREEFKVPAVWVALRRGHMSVTKQMVLNRGADILFGEPKNIDLWILRLERSFASQSRYKCVAPGESSDEEIKELHGDLENAILLLAVRRGKKILPMDQDTLFRKDDELIALLLEESREKTEGWLLGKGWKAIEDPAEEAPQSA